MNKARGKSGPLFNFDVHDDVRLLADATVEKDESHAGKVVERSWYQRNKHIFPASRWEVRIPLSFVRLDNLISCTSGLRPGKELREIYHCLTEDVASMSGPCWPMLLFTRLYVVIMGAVRAHPNIVSHRLGYATVFCPLRMWGTHL